MATTVATTTTTTGAGGMGSACVQDCSTIDVPPCFEAVCNEQTGNCDIGPQADGTACEDGAYCTVDDVCNAGQCKPGTARDCSGGNADPCSVPACDEALDSCSTTPAPNGTACTSTNPCETNTQCFNGQCLGAPKDCSATPLTSPECQAAECDPMTGQCAVKAINNGAPCTFGDICESNKSCTMGACEGTPIMGCTACTETEPNNLYSNANVGMGCASWAGGITTAGDKDCFRATVTVAGSRISAEVVDISGSGCPTGFDSLIRLYNAAGTQLVSDDDDGNNACSKFLPADTAAANLPVGDYSVCVEEFGNNGTSPPYLLLMSVVAPGCGNGIVEGMEQCDDGNTMNGDSCSSMCMLTVFDCAPGEVPVEIQAMGLPTAIPDGNMTGITNVINVNQMGTVKKVVVTLNITHTYDSDVDIWLDAPAAAELELSTDNGGSGDNYTNTVFAIGGASITGGTAPFTGVFGPEGNFATIVNTAATGAWTLRVADDVTTDAGTLDSWKLNLCVQP